MITVYYLFQRLISVASVDKLVPQEIGIKLVETSWFFQALAMANLFHSVGMLRASPTLSGNDGPYPLPFAARHFLKMRIFRKLPPNGGICDRFLEGVGRMNISLQNHRRLTIEKAVRMKTSDGSFHGPTFGRDVSGSVDPLVKPNYIKISNFKNLGFTCSTRSHPISTACNVYPGLITPLSVSLGGSHFSSKSSVLGVPP